MIVLDTTVLVYATGTDHPFLDPCRELVSAITAGRLSATTTVEVIQEFAHVRARRYGRADAAALAKDFIKVLAPLVRVTADELRLGLVLFEHVDGLGSFDAVLAAASLGSADALVSAERAFGSVPELTHVVPDSDGVRRLLASHT